MAPSAEGIRKTVERYIEAVATGTADDVVALYAEGATVEDPVGNRAANHGGIAAGVLRGDRTAEADRRAPDAEDRRQLGRVSLLPRHRPG